MTPLDRSAPIFIAGHRGLVGAATRRRLEKEGFSQVLTRSRTELDLRDASAVDQFFDEARPRYVVLAAAKVGGILANNSYPADFLRENLLIQLAVMDAARRFGVEKLAFLGSSCIYPREANQPIREDSLLTGPLEPTNQPYAIAKIAGIEMAWSYRRQYGSNFISLMPTNLYGPGDNFDLETSHVLPALMRKFHEAKMAGQDSVEIWGSGTPLREFLHVDDLADAILFLLDRYDEAGIVNVGSGEEVSILQLAETVRDVVGFQGEIRLDRSKPDGTPRKLMDSSRLRGLGWSPSIGLREGVESTYDWFLENHTHARV